MSSRAEIASGEYTYLATVWTVSQNYGVEKIGSKAIRIKVNKFLHLLKKRSQR